MSSLKKLKSHQFNSMKQPTGLDTASHSSALYRSWQDDGDMIAMLLKRILSPTDVQEYAVLMKFAATLILALPGRELGRPIMNSGWIGHCWYKYK